MSRQIRISINDDEVFERLRRRKDALDLSWEDALRRGLRDGPAPQRESGSPDPRNRRRETEEGREPTGQGRTATRTSDHPSPFDPDFGERIANEVLSSVGDAVPGFAGATLDEEIDRLEDAEDAVLMLGDGERAQVPLRVALHTGPEGLEVDIVAVRSGKDTESMNRFGDGARADVARRFAAGETATLELDGGEESYEVRPDLTWARGSDGTPAVTDVSIRDVVFEEESRAAES